MQRSLMASLNIHFYSVNHTYNIHPFMIPWIAISTLVFQSLWHQVSYLRYRTPGIVLLRVGFFIILFLKLQIATEYYKCNKGSDQHFQPDPNHQKYGTPAIALFILPFLPAFSSQQQNFIVAIWEKLAIKFTTPLKICSNIRTESAQNLLSLCPHGSVD